MVTHWFSDDRATYLPGSLGDKSRDSINRTREKGGLNLFSPAQKISPPYLLFQMLELHSSQKSLLLSSRKSGTQTGHMICPGSNKNECPELELRALAFSPFLFLFGLSPCGSIKLKILPTMNLVIASSLKGFLVSSTVIYVH